MRIQIIQIAVVLSALLVSGHLKATSLSYLVSSADAIVVGTESAAVQAGDTATFYLNVERVFTGPIPVGATVNVTWQKAKTGVPDGSPVFRGIWFLKQSTNGGWDCLPAGTIGKVTFFPDLSLPVSQEPLPAQLAYDASSTGLTDQIILETAAGTPRANRRLFLQVLPQPYSQGALQAFRYLASSTAEDQMLLGITALVEAGDTSGLLSAEKLSGTLTLGNPGADIATGIQVRFRNADPVAVAALGRMATSSEASALMQNAAAQALVAIHSQTTVPWFGLLLTAPSPQMQIYGAQGLSYFVNGVGIPTVETMSSLEFLNNRQPSPYRTADTDRNIGFPTGQPEAFIQFWQTWWQTHPELHTSTQ
jgi:hypothetical protein